jgi:hypothetical protein
VVGEWKLPELLQLFTELEFQVLADTVKIKMPPADDVVVVPAPDMNQVAAVTQAADARIVTGGPEIAPSSRRRRVRPDGSRSPWSWRPSGPSAPA